MNINKPLKTNIRLFTSIVPGILLLFFGNNSYSQVTDSIVPIKKNPEEILKNINIRSITNHGFNFWQDNFSGHWAGIDLGFNSFLNSDYSNYDTEFMNNNVFRSNSLYINLVQQSIGLQRNRNTIGIVTGLGIHFQSFRLDQNTTIVRQPDHTITPQTLYFNDNQRSKLSLSYVTAPILAEFQIPINHYENRLYISGGIVMSYRIGSYTKMIYREEKKEKLKAPDHYSTYEFKYALMFRTGYRWINVFVTYDLQTFFKPGLGPKLTPFSFGITLLRF
ncbi:MAG: hypothetical protein JXR61_08570 [Prolixibacteraceae bacterium]|nr:hypothetical protein [Prolixibacteraceae bacterium]